MSATILRSPAAFAIGAFGAALTLAAPTAAAPRQTAELSFAEQAPATPSAVIFNIDYADPDNPSGKPPVVSKVVTEFAPGTKIDTSVPERCTASDAELMAAGPDACPPGSRVGGGFATVDTGFAGPLRTLEEDLVFFNNRDELIFLFIDRATGSRLVNRSAVSKTGTTTIAPPLPGTPPHGGAIDVVNIHIDQVSRVVDGVRRGFVTTPEECPGSGSWANAAHFTFADGVVQSVQTKSPCERAASEAGRCSADHLGGSGNDWIHGERGGDSIDGKGGDDRLRGRRGDDCLTGRTGSDLLRGGGGADRLDGGASTDELRGGRGPDKLIGGPSRNDTCFGGAGKDIYRGCELRF